MLKLYSKNKITPPFKSLLENSSNIPHRIFVLCGDSRQLRVNLRAAQTCTLSNPDGNGLEGGGRIVLVQSA